MVNRVATYGWTFEEGSIGRIKGWKTAEVVGEWVEVGDERGG